MMKIRITESQYRILLKEDRVDYLKTQNVINPDTLNEPEFTNTSDMSDEEIAQARKKFERKKVNVTPVEGHDGVDIAYVVEKKGKKQIKVTEAIFNDIVAADPSANKQYVEWMLIVFYKHIKDGDIDQAIRFVTEDLPEAEEFLGVFDFWKKKKKKFEAAKNRPNAPKNPSDIRQYNDLAHLYSVISPFIGMSKDDAESEDEDDGVSKLYRKLRGFIDLGQANIVYHDSDVLIYVPNHIDASCEPLGDLASWCTRRKGNSYFDSYRRNKPKPDGSLSDYYVIMPKELFDMDNPSEHPTFPYQFHFESDQLHNKDNRSIGNNGVNNLITKYPSLGEFFKRELGNLSKMSILAGTGLMENKYLKYLNDFGGKAEDYISKETYEEGLERIKELAREVRDPDIKNNKYLSWLLSNTNDTNIVDYISPDSTQIKIQDINLGKTPDLSSFTNATEIHLQNCNLTEFPNGDLLPVSMQQLSVSNNRITNFSFENFDKFRDLFVISGLGNPINNISVEKLMNIIKTNKELVRIALSLESLSNKDEFINAIRSLCSSCVDMPLVDGISHEECAELCDENED